MSGTHAPLRIEIIDPVAEPLDGGRVDRATAAAPADGIDDWIESLLDAVAAARRHVDPLVRRAGGASARVQRIVRALHERSQQLRYDGNPRRGSAVRHHLLAPFAQAVDRLPRVADSIVVRPGVDLVFSSGFGPIPGGGRQASASLALRGSWPRLPVVVRVEPWWREQSIITVELRTRRRIRYPRRYFRSAHLSARAVGGVLSD